MGEGVVDDISNWNAGKSADQAGNRIKNGWEQEVEQNFARWIVNAPELVGDRIVDEIYETTGVDITKIDKELYEKYKSINFKAIENALLDARSNLQTLC